jgi:NAD(P)-dependent dehydrogenase (short-subunit alcohol dehydrogenase family)
LPAQAPTACSPCATSKGELVAGDINWSTEIRALDVTDLASIRAFAEGRRGPLDVLINNAGIMAVPEARTVDGFELQIGTNHLGPHWRLDPGRQMRDRDAPQSLSWQLDLANQGGHDGPVDA